VEALVPEKAAGEEAPGGDGRVQRGVPVLYRRRGEVGSGNGEKGTKLVFDIKIYLIAFQYNGHNNGYLIMTNNF
jgi:hypothetical protein